MEDSLEGRSLGTGLLIRVSTVTEVGGHVDGKKGRSSRLHSQGQLTLIMISFGSTKLGMPFLTV